MMPHWSGLIHDLFQEVSEWSQKNGWQITYSDTDTLEERFSTNPLPVLLLTVPEVPDGQIILQPQTLNGSGKGRIKMYASESLYRVRLLPDQENDGWTILTDSGISLHSPWGKETFTTLVLDLLRAG